jgi:hypothetical protein
VDDPGTHGVADPFKVRTVKQQGIHKGPGLVPGAGMDNQARRLVQNDDVAIFVKNGQRNGFRLARKGFKRRDVRLDDIAWLGQVPWLLNLSIDCDVTGPDQATGLGTGKGGRTADDDCVEPVAGV